MRLPKHVEQAILSKPGVKVTPHAKKRKRAAKKLPDPAAVLFESACVKHGLHVPVSEYRFCPPRRWRFDWCWPEHEIALEIEGGIWTGGRHTRGAGFIGDMEKYNEAAMLGWRVLRCTPSQVKSGEVFKMLKRVMRIFT